MAKTIAEIAKITSPGARKRAEKAYMKANKVKEGSKKDIAIDKATKTYKMPHGK